MTGATIEVVRKPRFPAPVDFVFPLCCPVEEYKWIPEWKCQLLHCPNERVEHGTVFTEVVSPPILAGRPLGSTTWTAVVHDPESHRVHFRLQSSGSDSLYKIELADDGAGGTAATLSFTYRALTRRTERLMAKDGEARLGFMLDYLAMMLEHYCRERTCISTAALAKFTAASDTLGRVDKLNLAIARLRQHLARDELRDRYREELAAGKR